MTTSLIKQEAFRLGFSACGISQCGTLPTHDQMAFETWLDKGMHADMHYMSKHLAIRESPQLLLEQIATAQNPLQGPLSIISLAYNYYTPQKQTDPSAPKIAKYALGQDYHKLVTAKLKQLLVYIQTLAPEARGRVFTDSAPIMERYWAAKSGIGWQGKNTLLIVPRKGSYYFLGEIIIELPLTPDTPIANRCGTCTRCIDACPTGALTPYLLDANKCISYITIENKSEIPSSFNGKMAQYMYGCDICQEACPWNRFAETHQDPNLMASNLLLNQTAQQWLELDETTYNNLFKESAVQRTRFTGLKRNIDALKRD